jgi:hypothetical protein
MGREIEVSKEGKFVGSVPEDEDIYFAAKRMDGINMIHGHCL